MKAILYSLITDQQRGNQMSNSEYANKRPEPKKPEPKKAVQVMLDKEHREFVEDHFYNKSDFYRKAVVLAIESHSKWEQSK